MKFSEKIAFVQKTAVFHPTEEKILILRRNAHDNSRPSDIDFPEGSVHPGEAHNEALKREVLEETGLQITDIFPVLVKSHAEPDDYFLFIGYCSRALTNGVTLDPKEHVGHEWMTIEEFSKGYSDHQLMEIVTSLQKRL